MAVAAAGQLHLVLAGRDLRRLLGGLHRRGLRRGRLPPRPCRHSARRKLPATSTTTAKIEDLTHEQDPMVARDIACTCPKAALTPCCKAPRAFCDGERPVKRMRDNFTRRAAWRGGWPAHAADRPARDGADSGRASRPSRRHSCRARSRADRASPAPAGAPATSSSITSGTRPPAIAGCCARPNSSCTRIETVGPCSAVVIDRHRRAGRRGEMGRRFGVEPLAQSPRQQRVERGRKLVGADLRQRRLAGKERRQPFGRRARQRVVGKIGPFVAFRRRRNCTRSRNCSCALLHGSLPMPIAAIPSASSLRALRLSARPLWFARPARARRAGGCAARAGEAEAASKLTSSRSSILSGKARLDLGERDRRRQNDAARRRGAGQFGHRQKRLARQRRSGIDIAAAAVGEQERAVAAAAALGDAVGIGEREQRAGRN